MVINHLQHGMILQVGGYRVGGTLRLQDVGVNSPLVGPFAGTPFAIIRLQEYRGSDLKLSGRWVAGGTIGGPLLGCCRKLGSMVRTILGPYNLIYRHKLNTHLYI